MVRHGQGVPLPVPLAMPFGTGGGVAVLAPIGSWPSGDSCWALSEPTSHPQTRGERTEAFVEYCNGNGQHLEPQVKKSFTDIQSTARLP